MSGYVRWLAARYDEVIRRYREEVKTLRADKDSKRCSAHRIGVPA